MGGYSEAGGRTHASAQIPAVYRQKGIKKIRGYRERRPICLTGRRLLFLFFYVKGQLYDSFPESSSIQHTRIMVSLFLALGEKRSSWGR